MRLLALFFLVCLFGFLACKPKQNGVEHLVEANWPETSALLDEFHSLFNKYFEMADDQLLASAIVFPELLRYSKLRDIIETEALKTLYVQYGTQYANFSIGPFQMKPSFAEDLERASLQNRFYYFLPSDTLASNKARLNRIKRLANSEGQMHYLFVFVQLMNLKFEAHQFESLRERVGLYATAYQAGYNLSIDELKQKQYGQFYHTDLLPHKKTKYYSYSAISLSYYTHQKGVNKRITNNY
ncbi:MAG TPA: hypothetical protein PLS94_08390 [Prolixibacteraceae bacterium]|nr:hypothetical protein [Prolixibacteraceae bacterium]